jgi:hypothetical protein
MYLTIFLFLYLSVSLSLSLSLSIYIYIHLFLFCMFVVLSMWKPSSVFVQAILCRLKRPPQIFLVVVALHHIKCAEIYGGSSYSMKRQEDHWYNDVPKRISVTLSICLSIYIYIYIYTHICFSSVSLSVILYERYPVLLSRPQRADWETPSNVAVGAGPTSYQMCCYIMRWFLFYEEARGADI